MGKVSNYANLQWLLASNSSLVSILDNRYASNHCFFPYVDGLVGKLRGRVQLLERKAVEVGNLQDFDSFVSEMKFATALCDRGKMVEMIPTSTWEVPGQVPDFCCIDGERRILFEVKRTREEEGIIQLTRCLQNYLRKRPYEVIARVKPKWTAPTNNPHSRIKRKSLVQKSLKRFASLFPRREIRTSYALYETKCLSSTPGYASIITEYFGDVSIGKYLHAQARKAAEKRDSWSSKYRGIPYVAAIEIEEPGAADDITITDTFCGPNGLGGAFARDPLLKNLSAVLVKNGPNFYYIFNSESDPCISPVGFDQFLPANF